MPSKLQESRSDSGMPCGIRLTEVVYFAHTVDWSRNSFHTRLDLQRQKLRVVTGLVQITTVKPQRRLTGWLPHITQFAFPRTRILIA